MSNEENKQKTILAIDDDVVALTSIRKMLEEHFEICLAKSADIAWNILNNTMVDMILLDVEMPDITGPVFLDYLRNNKSFQYIPVIFVTSHTDNDTILNAKKLGAKGFVPKPIDGKTLLEKIQSVFAANSTKSDRDALLEKLHLMEVACRTGKGADVIKLSNELMQSHYNVGTDDKLAEVYRCAVKFDYADALEIISNLIKNNLYDIR
jgi:response regulator RpfG family c-di-GMP phosphodiesterase